MIKGRYYNQLFKHLRSDNHYILTAISYIISEISFSNLVVIEALLED